jgi:hypothetical protein
VIDNKQHQSRLLQMAEVSCQRLFAHYGLALRRMAEAEPDPAPLSLYGSVSFSGKTLNGTMLLGSSREPLLMSNPTKNVAIQDWQAELTNQLVGRFKNQLLPYGVEINVGVPVSLRDAHMTGLQTQRLPSVRLRPPSGLLRIWLDLTFGARFQMADHPDPSKAGPQESDAILL